VVKLGIDYYIVGLNGEMWIDYSLG